MGEVTPDILRAWAKEQGIKIGDRGRVPNSIREAYIKVQPDYVPGAKYAKTDAAAQRELYETAAPKPVKRQYENEAHAAGIPTPPNAVLAPKPRKPRAQPKATAIRAEAVRVAGDVTINSGDPIRVKDTQGHWRFLGVVLQPGGKVYIDCVDPGGIGRAIDPALIMVARKGVTAENVRPSLAEREASATAHAHTKRG
jgi:hypothetical protein